MRKLSFWAKQNPWKARIIIILSHLLLIYLAWYIGSGLYSLNIVLSDILFFIFILYYLLAVFYYPGKNEKRSLSRYWYYYRQKVCDFSLVAAAFGMIICISNTPEKYFQPLNYVQGVIVAKQVKDDKPTAAQILESLKTRDKSTLTREEKRILKKEFKVQMKKYLVAEIKGNEKEGSDAAAIILAIVAALGLLYLVGVLACNLSCNGNDAAAVLVAVFGTAAIIVGLIFLIKGIKKKAMKAQESRTTTS